MLVRLAYLAVSNAFTVLRLLAIGGRDKGVEILALRHQITVLQRQLGTGRPRFEPADRALLAALLAPLPRDTLQRLQLKSDLTPFYAGTATFCAGLTPNAAGEDVPVGRAPSPRSAGWCCA